MSLTYLQVCMESSDWFQGTVPEELKIDSSSPSGLSDSILACSQPLMDRRLRPPQDHPLKCPRCDSTHTKFCYYNNYSLTQPRYFCKTCRRYWTKGGTLRNIPVGGGCRKTKKVVSTNKKSTIHHHKNLHFVEMNQNPNPNPNYNHNHNNELLMSCTDLQLSYPESTMQFLGSNLLGVESSSNAMGFMFENMNSGYGGMNVMGQSYHGGICSPFGGMTLDSINGCLMERGLIGYNREGNGVNDDGIGGFVDVKPNLLALEWQDDDQSSASATSAGGGYLTGLGSSWGGLVHGYGPPTTNPLV